MLDWFLFWCWIDFVCFWFWFWLVLSDFYFDVGLILSDTQPKEGSERLTVAGGVWRDKSLIDDVPVKISIRTFFAALFCPNCRHRAVWYVSSHPRSDGCPGIGVQPLEHLFLRTVSQARHQRPTKAQVSPGGKLDKPTRLIIRLSFGFVSDLSRSRNIARIANAVQCHS